MTRIQETSRYASRAMLDSVGPRQRVVLSLIKKNPKLTDREYADILAWEINEFVPRRNELMGMGWIKKQEVKYLNGRPAYTWKVA